MKRLVLVEKRFHYKTRNDFHYLCLFTFLLSHTTNRVRRISDFAWSPTNSHPLSTMSLAKVAAFSSAFWGLVNLGQKY